MKGILKLPSRKTNRATAIKQPEDAALSRMEEMLYNASRFSSVKVYVYPDYNPFRRRLCHYVPESRRMNTILF